MGATHDPVERLRSANATDQTRMDFPPPRKPHTQLVNMAPVSPTLRPKLPLSETESKTTEWRITAVGLARLDQRAFRFE